MLIQRLNFCHQAPEMLRNQIMESSSEVFIIIVFGGFFSSCKGLCIHYHLVMLICLLLRDQGCVYVHRGS